MGEVVLFKINGSGHFTNGTNRIQVFQGTQKSQVIALRNLG